MKRTTARQTPIDSAARQAAQYVARAYSGAMTEAEELAFQQWLDRAPQHASEYRRALATWDELDGLADDPHLASAGRRYLGRTRRRRGSYAVAARWAVAATLLIAVGVGFFNRGDLAFWSGSHAAIYATRVGEQKTVPLADGSVVMLNTDSQVQIDYSSGARRAVLVQGEAFFDIAKDAARPFTVKLGSQVVTVLGTRFNVYKKGAEITVAVEQGVVALHPADTPVEDFAAARGEGAGADKITRVADQYRLAAGAVITFKNRSEVTATSTIAGSDSYYPWQTGVVTFIDKPLAEVVAEMNRYTNRKVLISDAEIMNMRVSGVLHVKEVEQALFGMKAAFPLEVTFNAQSIILKGREM